MNRIFLIDDDPIFIFLFRKMIETVDNSAECEVYSDGELGLARIGAIAANAGLLPDFIFLDLNMPVLDGWGFLTGYKEIYRQFPKNVSLYIISSTISPLEIERSREFAFISGLIIKPPDRTQIADIILSGR